MPKIPKKITELTDPALLKLVRNNNSSEAFEELVNRHEKLFFDVCSKYSKKSPLIKYDEIINDKYFVIGEALKTYKQGRKAKFSTWVGHFTRFYCLKKITYLTKNHLDTGLETQDIDILNLNLNKFDEQKYDDIKDHINNLLSKIEDKRIKKIFDFRYFNGQNETWTEIAKKLNISAMHTINLHNKGCQLLKKELKDSNAI